MNESIILNCPSGSAFPLSESALASVSRKDLVPGISGLSVRVRAITTLSTK